MLILDPNLTRHLRFTAFIMFLCHSLHYFSNYIYSWSLTFISLCWSCLGVFIPHCFIIHITCMIFPNHFAHCFFAHFTCMVFSCHFAHCFIAHFTCLHVWSSHAILPTVAVLILYVWSSHAILPTVSLLIGHVWSYRAIYPLFHHPFLIIYMWAPYANCSTVYHPFDQSSPYCLLQCFLWSCAWYSMPFAPCFIISFWSYICDILTLLAPWLVITCEETSPCYPTVSLLIYVCDLHAICSTLLIMLWSVFNAVSRGPMCVWSPCSYSTVLITLRSTHDHCFLWLCTYISPCHCFICFYHTHIYVRLFCLFMSMRFWLVLLWFLRDGACAKGFCFFSVEYVHVFHMGTMTPLPHFLSSCILIWGWIPSHLPCA